MMGGRLPKKKRRVSYLNSPFEGGKGDVEVQGAGHRAEER